MELPSPENKYQAEHVHLLGFSYQKLIHKPLLEGNYDRQTFAKKLFEAPFAVVSHDTQDDPVFNYANRKALELFEMDWQEFTSLPSRLSAEAVNREERQRLLDQVSRDNFIDHYQGVRISKQGRRFLIKNAVVWNLIDEHGINRGQAAYFADWEFL